MTPQAVENDDDDEDEDTDDSRSMLRIRGTEFRSGSDEFVPLDYSRVFNLRPTQCRRREPYTRSSFPSLS